MSDTLEVAVFAAGCFWCTEAVFLRVEGVTAVIPGYTGGAIKNPCYRELCQGRTGHAEGIKITYDPSIVSYEILLEIFFATHDPTTLNQQGADRGTQYRSAIFYTSEKQRATAVAFIAALDRADVFQNDIVTEVTPLDVFYLAEVEHQEYYDNHKAQPYCQIVIDPKINKLKKYFKDQLKKIN